MHDLDLFLDTYLPLHGHHQQSNFSIPRLALGADASPCPGTTVHLLCWKYSLTVGGAGGPAEIVAMGAGGQDDGAAT